ncbi:anti-sigma factor family protein [Corynebacterium urinipleomorphum]|uniref:anti-sigma factor family protein n=1 Tax=Corynebacterium urinipleomorphum TaxID=1852380 RepID=UPI0013900E91|nr:anti-sigma factor [Corynebacterium urinipleomorphum]
MPNFDSIDHLNFEAVAALIDDELTPTALHRAQNHLAQCPDCRREVAQQKAAAEAVREHNTDGCLRAPPSLVERLAHLDEPPARGGSLDAPSRSGSFPDTPAAERKWPISWSRLRDGLK